MFSQMFQISFFLLILQKNPAKSTKVENINLNGKATIKKLH